MRCTKCHYLSFEPEPRCKNCGHDLSIDELTLPLDDLALDAPIASRDTLGDLDLHLDLDMIVEPRTERRTSVAVATMTPPALPKVPPAPVMAPAASVAPAVTVTTRIVAAQAAEAAPVTTELPLFMRELTVDAPAHTEPEIDHEPEIDLEPLVKVPARPRAPLAVRRNTPDPARMRARYTEPDLLSAVEDLTLNPVAPTPMHDEPVFLPEIAEPTPVSAIPGAGAAPFAARAVAAVIDLGVLGAVALTTIALTLRMADLTWAQITVLPAVPMLAFFALIGLTYEWMFTATSGQTIGKMLTGLRVVADDASMRPSPRQAAVRAISMLPLGAGLVSAIAGSGLAVHDRIAHTRVVRV